MVLVSEQAALGDQGQSQVKRVLETLDERLKRFKKPLLTQCAGLYRFVLSRGSAAPLEITAALHSGGYQVTAGAEALRPSDHVLSLPLQDFQALMGGQVDPMTLFITQRLQVCNGDGQTLTLRPVRKFLQMLLVGWHIDDQAIADLERIGSEPYRNAVVDRIAGLTPEMFLPTYGRAGYPVIVPGAAADWPLVQGSAEDLSEELSGVTVPLYVEDGETAPAEQATIRTAGRTYRTLDLGDFVENVFMRPRTLGDTQGVTPYVTAFSLPERLMGLIKIPPYFAPEAFVAPKLWAGSSGTLTPLHRDLIDNFLVQVWGYKHLRLIAPTISDELHPIKEDLNPYFQPSGIDVDCPDLDAVPECAGVPYVDCVLGPGDMLYLPAGWWHRVRAVEPSLSVNFFALNQQPLRLSGASTF